MDLAEVRTRAENTLEYWNEIYNEGRKDLKFQAGDQWDSAAEKSRKNSFPPKPCLTVNKLPQYINHICNKQKSNDVGIKVSPVYGTDRETAKILQGLINNIERDSDVDGARSIAFESAVRNGFGFYRINTRYKDDVSFDQEIYVDPVKDPFSVLIDPNSKMSDGSDMKFAFIFEDLPIETFKQEYPDKDIESFKEGAFSSGKINWGNDKFIKIAEYFVIEKGNKKTYYQLESGELTEKVEGMDVTGFKSRDIYETKVMWYKISGSEILEQTEWAGKYIPILPVYGQELVIDGKLKLISAIRYSKDPQKMYNYWQSTIAEQLTMAPKAPYIGATGQFDGREKQWRNANTSSSAYLEYKPVTVNGTLAPPPQRVSPVGISSGMLTASQNANDDIKSTMGIFDASLGARSNETSGRAIFARQLEGDVSTYHFSDNLAKTIKHEAKIYLDLIPKIKDFETVETILDDEGKEKEVLINSVDEVGNAINDITTGNYNVSIDIGIDFKTMRQEASNSMLEFMRLYPASSPVIGDLIAKNMDWRGSQEIADRLKKMIPPNIIEQKGEEAIKAQLQSVVQDMQKIMEENKQLKEDADKNRTEIEKEIIKSRTSIAVAKIREQPDTDIKFNYDFKNADPLTIPNIVKEDQDLTLQATTGGEGNFNPLPPENIMTPRVPNQAELE